MTGSGITAASTGCILKNRGYTVTAVKIDPYPAIDAGTMNCRAAWRKRTDGGEVLTRSWNHERFLDIDLSSLHNITTGKIYRSVIEKERRGDYLWQRLSQIIPHITDEIKCCIDERLLRGDSRGREGGHLSGRGGRDLRRISRACRRKWFAR